MLDDWHHLDLTQVQEQFIELFLACAVQDQIGSKHEDSCSQYGEYVQTFIAQDSIEQQEDLVNFQYAKRMP